MRFRKTRTDLLIDKIDKDYKTTIAIWIIASLIFSISLGIIL